MKLEFETNTSDFPFVDSDFLNGTGGESSSSEVNDLLRAGIKAAQKGNRAEARQMLLRVTEADSNNETAWLWLASISEYPEELLVFLNSVLKINPDNQRANEWAKATKSLLSKTFVQRGVDASNESQTEFARQCFLQAIVHDPSNEMAWLWLASIADSVEEKTSHLQKVLNINPENETALGSLKSLKRAAAESLHQKAVAAAIEGKTEAANQMLQEVLGSAPDFEDAWILKSHLANSFDEKIRCFERVLEINSENETARAGLASLQPFMTKAEPKNWEMSGATEEAEAALQPSEEVFDSPAPEEIAESVEPENDKSYYLDEKDYLEEETHDNHPTQDLEPFAGLAQEAQETFEAADENHAQDFAAENDFAQTSDDEETEMSFAFDSSAHIALPENLEEIAGVSEDESPEFVDAASFEAEDSDDSYQESSAPEWDDESASFDEEPQVEYYSPDYYAESENGNGHYAHFEEIAETAMPAGDEADAFEIEDEVFFESSAPEENEYAQESQAVEYAHEPVEAENLSFEENDFNAPEEVSAPFEEAQQLELEAPEQSEAESDEKTFHRPQIEFAACPFCDFENESQAFVCNSCRAVLSLSDLEMLLAQSQADSELLDKAVEQMETEKKLCGLDANRLMYLGIAYINLKDSRKGFSYLQEAARMNPDNVVLGSQVNALAIRLEEIEKQQSIHDAMPQNRKILVVDDSPTVRKLISGKLEKCGHEVVCAVDGVDALEKINSLIPDLILLDITMPRMDGYQVCKLIRNNEATKDVPVVMISGKDGFFDKVRGRMAGTTGYITKPFGPETLMKTVEAYIS